METAVWNFLAKTAVGIVALGTGLTFLSLSGPESGREAQEIIRSMEKAVSVEYLTPKAQEIGEAMEKALEYVSLAAGVAGGLRMAATRFLPRLATRGFVASWAVTAESQAGWSSLRLGEASAEELALWEDVINAEQVVTGRSVNVTGRAMFVLNPWLESRGIQWSQRWQDVYNRALFDRTSLWSKPVNVMAGSGYTMGEVTAAEAGARSSGILDTPYWSSQPLGTPSFLDRLRQWIRF